MNSKITVDLLGSIPVNNVLKVCRNPDENTDQTYRVFGAPHSDHGIDAAQEDPDMSEAYVQANIAKSQTIYCQQGLESTIPGPKDDTIAAQGSEVVMPDYL